MTAKEYFNKWNLENYYERNNHTNLIDIMKDFAKIKVKEALQIAAEKAKTKTIEEYSGNTGSEYSNDYDVVDKDSILNAINLDEFIK